MVDVRDDIREIKTDTTAIRRTIDEARGGWKALAVVSGISATVGGAVVKFLPQLMGKG